MAVETIKIIDFGKALEFFESAFNCLDQKEVNATDVKIIRLSVQRLSYTSGQINETCLALLAQIEALEIKRQAEADHQTLVGRIQAEFQAPPRRDTEKDVDEPPFDPGPEEIEPYSYKTDPRHPLNLPEKVQAYFAKEKSIEHQKQIFDAQEKKS